MTDPFDIAELGAHGAEQFARKLREERALHPGRSILFPRLGDARMRRQIVRWIGREYRAPTPGIVETLRTALDDDDWEVRVSAMLVAARLRVAPLRSAVNDVALPSAHRFGLDELDAGLLVAARLIAVAALDAGDQDDVAGAVEHAVSGASAALVAAVLGLAPPVDAGSLLLYALSAPVEFDATPPDPLPDGIVADGKRLWLARLAPPIEMVWVPPIPHMLGEEGQVSGARQPVRELAPAPGFFIARRPLAAGANEPPPSDPKMAARIAATPEPPLLADHERAIAICAALAAESGTDCSLPDADELEASARGTDGRRFPWGNGLERIDGTERSPWGVERFAVPIAQWSVTRDADGRPLILGGPDAPRCAGRRPADAASRYAVRPVVRAMR